MAMESPSTNILLALDHHDVLGMKLALTDLALEGINRQPSTDCTVNYSAIKTMIRNSSMKAWINHWENETLTCSQTKLWNMFPSPDLSKQLLDSLNRHDLSLIIQCITGHCFLNRHMYLVGKSFTKFCRFCHEDHETPWHLIGWCSHFTTLRLNYFSEQYLENTNLFSTPQGFNGLLGFLKETTINNLLAPMRI